jgi:hypothetical protein
MVRPARFERAAFRSGVRRYWATPAPPRRDAPGPGDPPEAVAKQCLPSPISTRANQQRAGRLCDPGATRGASVCCKLVEPTRIERATS